MNCACGQPLHYPDERTAEIMDDLVADLGEYVKITRLQDGRAWMVQRHYIALHGLKGQDLGTPAVPAFEEVAP